MAENSENQDQQGQQPAAPPKKFQPRPPQKNQRWQQGNQRPQQPRPQQNQQAQRPQQQQRQPQPQQTTPPALTPRERAADNIVFVGSKPPMAYVLAVVTQLSSNRDVCIKARGKAISRAVDVAEMVRNRFAKDAKIKEIKTATDRVKTEDGREINISAIEIWLAK